MVVRRFEWIIGNAVFLEKYARSPATAAMDGRHPDAALHAVGFQFFVDRFRCVFPDLDRKPGENSRGAIFPFFYGVNRDILPGKANHFFPVIVGLFLRYFLHFLLATV